MKPRCRTPQEGDLEPALDRLHPPHVVLAEGTGECGVQTLVLRVDGEAAPHPRLGLLGLALIEPDTGHDLVGRGEVRVQLQGGFDRHGRLPVLARW
jgi:hypothetical protein